ncbi:probable pectate lyase P59 [Rutidosis leptorrhynchoides]|uniref:probable pectate lyase P59 n=1 Tax=Rutidosis leptorrhynchoides TaxID=125765 RepID=UPI003A993881
MEGARCNRVLVLCLIIFAAIVPSLMAHNTAIAIRKPLGKKKGGCKAYNSIDKCWRCDRNWAKNRKKLASCAKGFGHGTFGGKMGQIYVVTDSSDKNVINPKPGTLRHAVLQPEPLWITFSNNMNIRLSQELIFMSDKTVDGRGFEVHVAGGAGIMLQFVHNVIIHGIHMYDIVEGSGGMIRSKTDHVGKRGRSDGDAISIFSSSQVWVDHCSFASSYDGLIDIVAASTNVTISNCHFVKHDKALLFGASDHTPEDKIMKVTLAYNHFGIGLTQRLPAVRFGFVHVVNNDYMEWKSYAIGGADAPTIISQGNRFKAADGACKEITKREQVPESIWRKWTWRSEGDLMLNGAYFRQSGNPKWAERYKGPALIPAQPAEKVGKLTQSVGASLNCKAGSPC